MPRTRSQSLLIVGGAVLFLLGLVQGGVVHWLENPRMALSAHLTAVQSGTALMIAGAVWPTASLRPQLTQLASSAILLGMYGLWIGLTLSALTGASEALPIAGAGYSASPQIERVVTVIVVASSVAMTMGWTVFVLGLVRRH